MSRRTILFVFAGIKADMELLMPFVHRILADHPQVEADIWNLSRTPEDADHLQTLAGDRITVRNDFYGMDCWDAFNDVYRHYTAAEYKDCLFVKCDQDIPFIETGKFGAFLEAAEANPTQVVSAQIINNGASTRTFPGLWEEFDNLGIKLLDVHLDARYARISHEYFFRNWQDVLDRPVKLTRTVDWLSIGFIGFSWAMGCEITKPLGRRSPRYIAGRKFPPAQRLGDEGRVNMLPRLIVEGFVACHRAFGHQKLPEEAWDEIRANYAIIGRKYLEDR